MIKATDLAACAVSKVRTPPIPYVLGGRSDAGTDCINLVGWCVQELSGMKDDVPRGSNTAWRTAMQWRGTLAEAKAQDRLVPGALLFICDGPTADWPDGDYSHAGIYVGKEGMEVVHASSSRDGVHASTLKNGWTHVAWLNAVVYTGGGGTKVAEVIQARVATNEGDLNLRNAPSGQKIGSIPKDALVDVLDSARSDWWQVRYNGFAGWAAASYLTVDDPLERVSQLLQQATAVLNEVRRS